MDLERLSRKDLINRVKQLEEQLNNLQSTMFRELSEYQMKCKWSSIDTHTMDVNKKYMFITQTFDQSYYLPQNHNNQIEYMTRSIDQVQHLYNLEYVYYVLENHNSGVVHMHAIIYDPDYNNMIEFCFDLRSYFTNKPKYLNRVNQQVEVIKQNNEDYFRVVDYMQKAPILRKIFNKPIQKPKSEYDKQKREEVQMKMKLRKDKIKSLAHLLDEGIE